MHQAVTDLFPDPLSAIASGMTPTLHWFPEDVSFTQLTTTLVAMANTDGGAVFLGLSPRAGEVIGVSNIQSAYDKIFQAALMTEPVLVLPIPRQVAVQNPRTREETRLLVITVPPGLPNIYSVEGRYFGRDGSQNNPIPASRLYILFNERGSTQFESRAVLDATVQDLDSGSVLAYAHSFGNVPPSDLVKAHDFLVKRGCLKRVEGNLQVTYAGLLLFGNYPQQWLPNATILAGRFPGFAMSDAYIKRDISGNLPTQLLQTEEFIRSNLQTTVRLVGLTHQEKLEYPFEAVRELLVNAVAHRDYNLQGDNIHLNIFSDRLVVTSPGSLPGPVTLENLLEARFARNAVISQVLSDLGYVERLGYGLDRVVSVTRAEGLLPPQFEEAAGTFRVTLFSSQVKDRHDKSQADLSRYSQMNLNSRQQLALTQLATHQRITSHEYQLLCPDVHAETLRRDMADLVDRGILIKVGDKKATYYILKRM